jgi:hypothetical protein
MRNNRKVENDLPFLSHDEQDFAAHFGAQALGNKALFELAREVHHEIKLKLKTEPGRKLLSLFRDAVEKEDFTNVATFVELLADWTSEAEEVVKGIPGFGYWIPGGKDPVTKVLLQFANKLVRLSNKPFDCKWVRVQKLEQTAKQVMNTLRLSAPGFQCDIKTLRNRANELGLSFAPDKRGLRKGQKRRHVHRARLY